MGLSYDFAGEQTTVSGKFTGGGDRFTVKGAKVKKLSGPAGLGLTYASPRWSIGADYALTTRSTYTGHPERQQPFGALFVGGGRYEMTKA